MGHQKRLKRQTSSNNNAAKGSQKPIEITENKVQYLDEDTARRLGILKGDEKQQYLDESSDMLTDPSLKDIVKHFHESILDEKPSKITNVKHAIEDDPVNTISNDHSTKETTQLVSPIIDISEKHVKQLEEHLDEIARKHGNLPTPNEANENTPEHRTTSEMQYHDDPLVKLDANQNPLSVDIKDIAHRQYGKSLTRIDHLSQEPSTADKSEYEYLAKKRIDSNLKDSADTPSDRHNAEKRLKNILMISESERNDPDLVNHGMHTVHSSENELNKEEADEQYVRLPGNTKNLMEKYAKGADPSNYLDTRDALKTLDSTSSIENDLKRVQNGPDLSADDYRRLVAPNDIVLNVLKTRAMLRNHKDSPKENEAQATFEHISATQNEIGGDPDIDGSSHRHSSDIDNGEKKNSFRFSPSESYEKSSDINQNDFEANTDAMRGKEKRKPYNEDLIDILSGFTKPDSEHSQDMTFHALPKEINVDVQSDEKTRDKERRIEKTNTETHSADDLYQDMLRKKGVWHPDGLELVGATAETSRRKLVDADKYLAGKKGRWHPGVENIDVTDQVFQSPSHLPHQIVDEIADHHQLRKDQPSHLANQLDHGEMMEKLHHEIGSYNFDGLQDINPGSSFQLSGKGEPMIIGDVYSRNKLAGELDHVINEDWDLKRDDPAKQDSVQQEHIKVTLDSRNNTINVDTPSSVSSRLSTNSSSSSLQNSSSSSSDGSLFDMFLTDDSDKINSKTLLHSIKSSSSNISDDMNAINDMFLIFNHSSKNTSSDRPLTDHKNTSSGSTNRTVSSFGINLSKQNVSSGSEKEVLTKRFNTSKNIDSIADSETHIPNQQIAINRTNHDNDTSLGINSTRNATISMRNTTQITERNETSKVEFRKDDSARNKIDSAKNVNGTIKSAETVKIEASIGAVGKFSSLSHPKISNANITDTGSDVTTNRNDSSSSLLYQNRNEIANGNITIKSGSNINITNATEPMQYQSNSTGQNELKISNKSSKHDNETQGMNSNEKISSPNSLGTASLDTKRISDMIDEQTTSKLLQFLAPLKNVRLMDDSARAKSIIDNDRNPLLAVMKNLQLKKNYDSMSDVSGNDIGRIQSQLNYRAMMKDDTNQFATMRARYDRPEELPLVQNNHQGGIAFPISLAKYIDLEPVLNPDGSIRYVSHRMRENIIMPNLNMLKQKMAEETVANSSTEHDEEGKLAERSNFTPLNISKPTLNSFKDNLTSLDGGLAANEIISKNTSSLPSQNSTKDINIFKNDTLAANKTVNATESSLEGGVTRSIQNVDSAQALLKILDFNQALSERIKNLKKTSQPFKSETTNLIKTMLSSMNSFYSVLNKTLNSTMLQDNGVMRNIVEGRPSNDSSSDGNSVVKMVENATASNSSTTSIPSLRKNTTHVQNTTANYHNFTSTNASLSDLERYNYNFLQDISKSLKDSPLNQVIIDSLKRRYSSPFILPRLPGSAYSDLDVENEEARQRGFLGGRFDKVQLFTDPFGHQHLIAPLSEENSFMRKLPLQVIASKRNEFLSPIYSNENGRMNDDLNATITPFQVSLGISRKFDILGDNVTDSKMVEKYTSSRTLSRVLPVEKSMVANSTYSTPNKVGNTTLSKSKDHVGNSSDELIQVTLHKNMSDHDGVNMMNGEFSNVSKHTYENATLHERKTLESVSLSNGIKESEKKNEIDKSLIGVKSSENNAYSNSSNHTSNANIEETTKNDSLRANVTDRSSQTRNISANTPANTSDSMSQKNIRPQVLSDTTNTTSNDRNNTSNHTISDAVKIKDKITSPDIANTKNHTINDTFPSATKLNETINPQILGNNSLADALKLRSELLLAIKHVKENAFQLLSKNID